ncbi:MAG: hypothetical protein E6662_11860 [Pantoea sp.]|nr:hypothetical protein [Pantoea sp.]
MNDREFKLWMNRTSEEKKRESRMSKRDINLQYGLPADYKAPTDKDVARAVEAVSPTPKNKQTNVNRSGLIRRQGRVIVNPCTVYFKLWASYGDMPSRSEDIFTGCCKQSDSATDNTKVNPRTVFAVLRSIPFITTESVLEFLNRKRDVLQDAGGVNERYAQYICLICERVIRVFQHHKLFVEHVRVSAGSRVMVWEELPTEEDFQLCTLPEFEPYEQDYVNNTMSDAISSNRSKRSSYSHHAFNMAHIEPKFVEGWCAYRGVTRLPCGVHTLSRLVKCNQPLKHLLNTI